jgi:Autoinducer binding domain
MVAMAQSFGREAFEFIEDLDALSSPTAVGAATADLASQFGFEWFVFMGLAPQPGQSFDDLVYAGRFPPGFREMYASKECARFDPNVHRPSPRPAPSNGAGPSMARPMDLAPPRSCGYLSISASPVGS